MEVVESFQLAMIGDKCDIEQVVKHLSFHIDHVLNVDYKLYIRCILAKSLDYFREPAAGIQTKRVAEGDSKLTGRANCKIVDGVSEFVQQVQQIVGFLINNHTVLGE